MHALKVINDCGSVGFSADAFSLSLEDIISALSDADLAILEDELDFFGFTGVPSPKMLDVMDRAGLLDENWQNLLAANRSPDVPKPRAAISIFPHRRDGARHQPFRGLPALPELA